MYRANKQEAIPHAKINQKSVTRSFHPTIIIRGKLYWELVAYVYVIHRGQKSSIVCIYCIFYYYFTLCALEGVPDLWIVLLYIDTTYFSFSFKRCKKYAWDYPE